MHEKIQTELRLLVDDGRETLEHTTFIRPMNETQLTLAKAKYASFKTRSLNLIRRALGMESDHYRELLRLSEGQPEFSHFATCLGIVEAAQSDLKAGLLFDMRAIIEAEVLGDFIDQAETLLAAKYHVPAASLAGAVLEDVLRKLWVRNGLSIPQKTNINSLNTELAKAGEYNALTQKQITAHADVRNSADHGRYGQFKAQDVEDMIKWVRQFSEDHLR